MGDYTDGISTSERAILGDMHDTTKETMRNTYKGVAKTLTNELSFMKGRIVGMLGGNHFFEFESGTTTDHVLAHNLNAKYLGVCGFVRINVEFGEVKKGQDRGYLDIFAHHGKGGGTLVGSTVNAIDKMQATADADFYLMGHTHGKATLPATPKLKLIANKRGGVSVRERTPWLGRTGSFLKAYEPGKKSYNVDAGRSPCALGWIEYEITPTRVKKDGLDFVEFKIRGTS